MARVTGQMGPHSIEVWYGKQFSTKDLSAAFKQVKETMVESSRNGFQPGKILHYINDRKDCKPVEIPFNTGALSLQGGE